MKFYYIDDSYFGESSFLVKLRKRFLHLCEQRNVKVVFVSGTTQGSKSFAQFSNTCHTLGIQVLTSPSAFDIDGLKGVLSCTSLHLEGFEILHCYSGTTWYGDCDTMEVKRLYLELFLSYEEDEFVKELSDEIEHVLKDLMLKKGKTKNNHYH